MLEEKKMKLTLSIIIGILTLVILVFGATYAYFTVGTNNNFGTASINATAADVGNITLTVPTNSIHVSVSAVDMMATNAGKLYFATDDSNENYTLVTNDDTPMYMNSVIANTYEAAKLTLSNDSSNTTYRCTFNMNLTVTGDMANVFVMGHTIDGHFYLYNKTDFNTALPTYMSTGNMRSLMSTIYYMGSPTGGTYPVTVELNGSNRTEVSLGIVLYIQNSSNAQDYLAGKSMTVQISNSDLSCKAINPNEEKTSAPNTLLEGKTNVSTELLGGLYRYQGSANNNYICFGTNNASTCTSNTDKYMYRIIGVTSDNKLKLIKNESIGNMRWSNNYSDNITWPNSDLYNAINGTSFLNNTTYVPDSTWSNKIATTTWKYGDIRGHGFNGDMMYSLESAWNTTTSAKIGLMYQHDYAYGMEWLAAYAVGNSTSEWMITRFGLDNLHGRYGAWLVYYDGSPNWNIVNNPNGVRPVFYLTSGVTLSGEGTSASPYIIG